MAKTIVLLSDGTGNSSGKLTKTNVWRFYKALDLADPSPEALQRGDMRQIAYYDDGVGTSSFKPLALIGGVFGWGLKRNILDLYEFLCRNYEEGDRIYALGFSRGAFTIRTLVDMIAVEGVLHGCTEHELSHYSRDIYRVYRRRFNQTGRLVRLLRWLRYRTLGAWRRVQGLTLVLDSEPPPSLWGERPSRAGRVEDLGRPAPSPTPAAVGPMAPSSRAERLSVPEIAFVGVWDTVAAYGTPLSELTRGIDKWIWPLSMNNYGLSSKVAVARHALALDDERDTFHPLFWDEVTKPERRERAEAGKVQQVWFAGMHSDVGGGYPDDSLAHASLDWMMDEAKDLRFRPDAVEDVKRTRDDCGPMHDSRRGLGGYYRYQPRKIGARIDPPDSSTRIMRDPALDPHGQLRRVLVHESVIRRIASGDDQYAPIVLPPHYEVVIKDGIVPAAQAHAMMDAERGAPVQDWGKRLADWPNRQNGIWNDVWRRRLIYFSALGVSLTIAAMPLTNYFWPSAPCVQLQCVISPAIRGVGTVLPQFAQSWVEAFALRPGTFLILVGALVGLITQGAATQRRIHDRARAFWLGLPDLTTRRADGLIERVRKSDAYQNGLRTLKWSWFPNIFGFGIRAFVVIAAAVLALRVNIGWMEADNGFCADNAKTGQPLAVDTGQTFTTQSPCWKTGETVTARRVYQLTIKVPASQTQWRDNTVPATPFGIVPRDMPVLVRYGVIPLRRWLAAGWFQPLVRIETRRGATVQPVGVSEVLAPDGTFTGTFVGTFVAAGSGEVSVTVNDAVTPHWLAWLPRLRGWETFYRNNHGTALVTVREKGQLSKHPEGAPTMSGSVPL